MDDDDDVVLSDQSTGLVTAQVGEEYRLLAERSLRSSGRPPGLVPSSG